jgi:hypothetical protein
MSIVNHKKFLITCLFFLFAGSVYSETQPENESDQNPKTRKLTNTEKRLPLAGFVPGLGQALLGNYGSAAVQFSLFSASVYAADQYRRSKDYIQEKDRIVKFDPVKYFFAMEIRNRGLDYLPYPLLTESAWSRDSRVFREANLYYNFEKNQVNYYELSPFLKYGKEYGRTNFTTQAAWSSKHAALEVMMYSVYSTYGDVSGHGQSFQELALSPFYLKGLTDYRVWIPAIVHAILSNNMHYYGESIVPEGQKAPFLTVYGLTGVVGAPIAEEAFFRGYLNPLYADLMDHHPGILVSSAVFGLMHYPDQGLNGAISATSVGIYNSYLTESYHGDLRPAILVHMLTNLVGIYYGSKHLHEDPIAAKGSMEVHIMQPFYMMSF